MLLPWKPKTKRRANLMHFMDPRPTVQFSSVNEAIPEVSLRLFLRSYHFGYPVILRELGVTYFPTNWEAKEPQNPQNHSLVVRC